mgnify:CR=1 FL=1
MADVTTLIAVALASLAVIVAIGVAIAFLVGGK